MKRALIVFLSLFLFTSIDMFSQSKKELNKQKEKEEYLENKKLIESGNYVFEASEATSQSGRIVNIFNEGYSITMNDKIATGDFPFYGDSSGGSGAAYGDGGIKFEGRITDFEIKYKDKKNKLTINFQVKSGPQNFYVTLNVYGSGNIGLIVSSNSRSIMKYYGNLKELKEKSKVSLLH